MTGVAMGFVLGGSFVRIEVAWKGGTLGGILIGIIVIAALLTLFANISFVKNAEMSMFSVIHRIHLALALIYAITIFALVFNTAFSLYYATARRFSKGDTKRMRMILIALTAVGYLCSFGGFKAIIKYYVSCFRLFRHCFYYWHCLQDGSKNVAILFMRNIYTNTEIAVNEEYHKKNKQRNVCMKSKLSFFFWLMVILR